MVIVTPPGSLQASRRFCSLAGEGARLPSRPRRGSFVHGSPWLRRGAVVGRMGWSPRGQQRRRQPPHDRQRHEHLGVSERDGHECGRRCAAGLLRPRSSPSDPDQPGRDTGAETRPRHPRSETGAGEPRTRRRSCCEAPRNDSRADRGRNPAPARPQRDAPHGRARDDIVADGLADDSAARTGTATGAIRPRFHARLAESGSPAAPATQRCRPGQERPTCPTTTSDTTPIACSPSGRSAAGGRSSRGHHRTVGTT